VRCAERQWVGPVTIAARMPQTRWRKTDTTLGPVAKVIMTITLVVPTLVLLVGVLGAKAHPANAFLVVPLGAFVVINVQLLPALWEPGRRRDS
jgi:hypothetical protein